MTTDEVRACAERMNRMAQAKLGIPMAPAAKAWVEDNWAVSTAWMAEHPADDGEPITAERLAAAGFAPPNEKYAEWISPPSDRGRVAVSISNYGDPPLISCTDNDIWCHIPAGLTPQTWGQFRRLCAALGVPL